MQIIMEQLLLLLILTKFLSCNSQENPHLILTQRCTKQYLPIQKLF